MIELNQEDKFFIEDDDGNLILVNGIEVNREMLQARCIQFKGTKFYVDYESDDIDKGKVVNVQLSFYIEDMWDEED